MITTEKLKNKNTIILIVSAVMVIAAIIIAISAAASSSKSKKEKAAASENNISTTAAQTTEPVKSFVYNPGKYRVATENNDSLCLRLEPNTSSDRIIYIASGTEVDIIAIWEDWGYTVYGNSGGWLSLNYLELVSSAAQTTAPAAAEQTAAQ